MTEWQGITIRDLLERVDLLNFINPEEDGTQNKDFKLAAAPEPADPSAAFLGPKLWDKPISLPPLEEEEEEGEGVDGDAFDVMNMEDFLLENNIRLDSRRESTEDEDEPLVMELVPEKQEQQEAIIPTRPNIIVANKEVRKTEPPASVADNKGSGVLAKGGSNDFLYTESKKARQERERAERKRRLEQLEFAPEDLALATVPGLHFDPKERAFAAEELRPQPIIKKRCRSFTPEEMKDEHYWEKRIKNNVAARRSREARRLKENQIALRAAFLEKENRILKRELDDAEFRTTKINTEVAILKRKLAIYEAKNNMAGVN